MKVKRDNLEVGATRHEFVFYQKIGEFSDQGSKIAKKMLQAQYKVLMEKRVKWGYINLQSLKTKIQNWDNREKAVV